MPDKPITMQLQVVPSGQRSRHLTGKGIEVIAITAGIGNGWIFQPAVLQASQSLWDKAECYTDHTPAEGAGTFSNHSVRDLGGILSNPTWDNIAQGIRALLSPTGPASQVVRDVAEAALAYPELPIGLSADILMRVEDKTVLEIIKVKSLDIVTHPARGGKFVRMLQSQGESPMTDPITPLVPPVEPSTIQTEQTLSKLAAGAQAVVNSLQAQDALAKLEASNASAEKLQIGMCQALLQTALAASRLPDPWQTRIREDFKDSYFDPETLQKRIEDDRALLSITTASRSVQGPGRIGAMVNSADQLQAAFDDLLGAPRDADKVALKVPRLTGIREAYLMLTGDYDMHGGFDPVRAQLGGTTTDFTGLVKNALNKIVVNSFERMGKAGYDWWKSIVIVEHFNNLNTITGTLIGTIGSLPSVAEQAEYTELATGDSPETASFTKYGGYIPLTLEAIDRDETRKLRLYAIELGNAAMRNISEQVAAIFTQNSEAGPVMADGGALFNATAVTSLTGHANLLTTALAAAQWDVVAAAVYNQPMLIKQDTGYYGTGKKLAIEPRYCLVPRALRKTAFDAFLNAWDVTSQVHAENLLKGNVVPLVVPEWTHDNAWAAVCDPNIAPSIIVGERFGLVPEIYIASNETDPAVFMNDEHRLKVRQFLALCIGDFRPLHKSNVV